MMGLWIAVAGLTAVALGLLLVPLARRQPAALPGRAEFDLTVYRDQLREVDQDLERGLLGAGQAAAARTEIQRRILATTDGGTETPTEDSGGAAGMAGNWPLMALIAVLVPAGAVTFYLAIGTPGAPDQPLAERAAARHSEVASGEQMVARLAERLVNEPDNLDGWMLLGRSYLTMGRYDDAVGAFSRALEISGNRPDVAATYGESLVAAADTLVTPEAREVFLAVLQDDPVNPTARFFLGLERSQQGDVEGALQAWVDLAALSPADAPWLPALGQRIEDAARQIGVDPQTLEPTPEAAGLAGKKPPANEPSQ